MEDDKKPLTEAEKKARKKAERERKRNEARENAEKKKRFGLTPEKKRKLKILIMQKASEDLKNEALAREAAKNKYLSEKVKELPNLDMSNEASLVSLCKELHRKISEAEEAKYDMEMKIRKNDYEINELTVKVNDIKGKFIKPTLKKVSKTKNKFAKIEKLVEPAATVNLKANLKSTGIDKFALDEDKLKEDKVDFREQLKSAKEAHEAHDHEAEE
jgi:hypothetical protein